MNIHYYNPLQLILSNFEDTIILDAEVLEPNRLRISIPPKKLKKLVEFIAQHHFDFRSMIAYEIDPDLQKRIEMQYIFEKLFENRAYQLICCLQSEETEQPILIESISDLFPASKVIEQKIAHHWNVQFLHQRKEGGLTFIR